MGRALKWVFSLAANILEIAQNASIEQAKNLAALVAVVDPSALVALGALVIGEARK